MSQFLPSALPVSGISLTQTQIRDFERFEEILLDWNRRFNLTAITGREDIRTKHFLDSLSCLKAIPMHAGMRVIDIGTGAGFPGIPLKIAVPEIRLTLVESIRKKADFCRHVTAELNLREVTVLNARAEDVGQNPAHREQHHWAVARAVAELSVLAEYLLPLVKVGGFALAQKGENGPAEAHAAAGALRLLGGAVEKITPIELPGIAEARYLIVIRKTAATPPQYPRRAGMPSKKPLGGGASPSITKERCP
ncbi:MAG: 16S rRNA (guanine(527)-N(7))-methyltransferase RsmG [Anaerolineales bacterium]|nr:16S rRNA (guanine(527)-N(7))-methyltransferase RsmG [Anaerolineales bacterium]